jgi:heme-degrading monooxygenase HmoA
MHAALRRLPGFLGAERLRGLDTPALFADYVLWASRADGRRVT